MILWTLDLFSRNITLHKKAEEPLFIVYLKRKHLWHLLNTAVFFKQLEQTLLSMYNVVF